MVATKRLAINKANAQMVIAVSVASFVTVFCLIAAHAVLVQNQYTARVTKQKEIARNQLDANIQAFGQLVDAYKKFDSQSPNVLSGSRTGTADNDGSNSKLVLDALPSSYDFPALTSSLEKILTNQPFKLGGISGTDTQGTQAAEPTTATAAKSTGTKAEQIPFTFSVTDANYTAANNLITRLERSIRPIQIDTLNVTGSGNALSLSFTAHTFYQAGTSVTITEKEVK